MTRERIDRLYELLPALHRMRDHEQGEPLRALLQVIADQVNLVEDDIEQLYENWFIETCEEWVVPYIGDLIGHQPVHEAGQPGDVTTESGRRRNSILSPRREVANTIRSRRRKGTLALLEQIARDVAGWPARVVEFRRLLAQSASIDALEINRGRLADLRSSAALSAAGTAFDAAAHLPDVRRMTSIRKQGRYATPSVGVFIWRLGAYSVTDSPASCVDEAGPHCYTFSVLGNDAPLFNHPRTEEDSHSIAGALNVPATIGRREFTARMQIEGKQQLRASPDYYGVLDEGNERIAQSIAIWADGWPTRQPADDGFIPASRIVPADLRNWAYIPPNGQIAVDPVRGRIAFPPRQLPKRGVRVSYYYGFSAPIGGGEYSRPVLGRSEAQIIRVRGKDQLQTALDPWRPLRSDDGDNIADPRQPVHAIIEIDDSGVYALPVNLFLGEGHTLQLRAAQRRRPVFRLLDWQTDLPDNMVVAGLEGSRFILDGILVAGRGIQVEGALRSFTVRHSTLVPGWSLRPDCGPERPSEPSIELIDSHACVVIEHSIVGSIQVNNDEVQSDAVTIRASDSIIDATGSDCDSPECEAIGAAGSRHAHAVVRIVRSTIIGKVMVHAIELAENSIFTGCVQVARRQIGCMRFCYVRPPSRTPRRFNCQPDLVQVAIEAKLKAEGATDEEIEAAAHSERLRVWPHFNSTRYGTPTYCQLAQSCAPEIVRGADDESEMGVFHDLFQPQREANLRARLDEYAPAATDTGIILET